MLTSVNPSSQGARQALDSHPVGGVPFQGQNRNVVPLPTPAARNAAIPPQAPRREVENSPPSLGDLLASAIRPSLDNPSATKPAGIRASLKRFDQALEALCSVTQEQDPLLQTARLIVAEECCRVEMLRQRMQMVLKD